MASSKARGEREPEVYPLGYVEDSVELRTKLEGIFTILFLSEQRHHGQTDQQVIHRMRNHTGDEATGLFIDPGPQESAPEHAHETDESIAVRQREDTCTKKRSRREGEPAAKHGKQQATKRQFLENRGKDDILE